MIIIASEDIANLLVKGTSRKYIKVARNRILYDGLKRTIKIMQAIDSIDEIKKYSFLHYEKLKYNYSGLSSVRLSNGYVERLIFREFDDAITLELIEINEDHYGNK